MKSGEFGTKPCKWLSIPTSSIITTNFSYFSYKQRMKSGEFELNVIETQNPSIPTAIQGCRHLVSNPGSRSSTWLERFNASPATSLCGYLSPASFTGLTSCSCASSCLWRHRLLGSRFAAERREREIQLRRDSREMKQQRRAVAVEKTDERCEHAPKIRNGKERFKEGISKAIEVGHLRVSSSYSSPSTEENDHFQKPEGEIHVIVGPMFAGKTTTSLRRVKSESSTGRIKDLSGVEIDHQIGDGYEMDAMKIHNQVSGYEGFQELKKIAMSIEKKVHIAATSQSDYMRKICFKILTIETRSQNPVPEANSVIPLDPVIRDSSMESVDWRVQLQADSRQRIVNKIIDTLKRHIPYTGHEGLQELEKIAVKFEDRVYIAATSQSAYLREISLKMIAVETR
ncbi:hypothetical protein L1887_27894 [Cichorium endivia]|nr:hypothetical protein L1887_27894 [Cichorium endivia]